MAVILGSDALSRETIDGLLRYVESRKTEFCWSANLNLWDKSIVRSSTAVLSHRIEGALKAEVLAELFLRRKLPYLPRNAVVMFYIWTAGSYISWHSDYLDKNSMSVYLHEHWDSNHGGYFCWRDWSESFPRHDWSAPPRQCNMVLPEFNNYVYMSDAEWHTVMMTTPDAPARLSLQMFFEKPESTLSACPAPTVD